MDKNTMIGLGVVALVLIGGLVFVSARNTDSEGVSNDMSDEEVLVGEDNDADELDISGDVSVSAQMSGASDAQDVTTGDSTDVSTLPTVATVRYTDSGFEPSVVRITPGGTVTFINESDSGMWVASDDHPTHTLYSEFDQEGSVEEGGAYRFPFLRAGTWTYHNHLESGHTGTIVVGN